MPIHVVDSKDAQQYRDTLMVFGVERLVENGSVRVPDEIAGLYLAGMSRQERRNVLRRIVPYGPVFWWAFARGRILYASLPALGGLFVVAGVLGWQTMTATVMQLILTIVMGSPLFLGAFALRWAVNKRVEDEYGGESSKYAEYACYPWFKIVTQSGMLLNEDMAQLSRIDGGSNGPSSSKTSKWMKVAGRLWQRYHAFNWACVAVLRYIKHYPLRFDSEAGVQREGEHEMRLDAQARIDELIEFFPELREESKKP